MGQVCTVCQMKDVAAINRMVIDGVPLREIVERCGTSLGTLHRHKAHIPATLATAKQAEQVADASSLLSQVQTLLSQAQRLTDAAEHAKNLSVALNGVRSIAGVLTRFPANLKRRWAPRPTSWLCSRPSTTTRSGKCSRRPATPVGGASKSGRGQRTKRKSGGCFRRPAESRLSGRSRTEKARRSSDLSRTTAPSAVRAL